MSGERHAVEDGELSAPGLLPDAALGIDAGLTLTKIAHARGGVIALSVHATSRMGERAPASDGVVGATGARIAHPDAGTAVEVQEIEAAARGVVALLRASGATAPDEFLLALAGTGTAFAAVRAGKVAHLGGTALGGGSFEGIARRIAPALDYAAMIAAAERGDRRRVDLMISDAYADGIGRIGPDLTAAHLSKPGDFAVDDVLAGLLNLHGENIAQIAASRAVVAKLPRIILAGGFAHANPALVASIQAMVAMFGIALDVAPWAGFAGAVGAAIVASEQAGMTVEVQE